MKTRTTQEDRDALRKYFVELFIVTEKVLPPRFTREKFMLQVLLDCQDAIDRIESMEHRLKDVHDHANTVQQAISLLLTEARR